MSASNTTMLNAITLDATTDDGRPLEALADLIVKRVDVLRESTRDAIIATAITALKSIRAATYRFSKKNVAVESSPREKLSISISQAPDLRVGFTGRDHRVCVRDMAGNRRADIRPWIRCAPSRLINAKVFILQLSDDRVEAWQHQKKTSYLIAESLSVAQASVRDRFGAVARKSGGFARDALSAAMQMVSSRPAKLVSKRAALISSKGLVTVTKDENGIASGTFSVEVDDNLNYAISALQGGEPYVATALAKAANAVNGYINNFMDSHPAFFFKDQGYQEGETPFPADAFDPESGLLI